MDAFLTESNLLPVKLLILSLYNISFSKGSYCGFSIVLLILAKTGNDILASLGNNFPASIFAAISNCVNPVFARSFIFCSILPKPEVWLFTETATVPKSAKVKSILPKAAQDPASSKSDNLNSFTQTSASIGTDELVFSKAIKIPLTSPKLGFPITEYLCLP